MKLTRIIASLLLGIIAAPLSLCLAALAIVVALPVGVYLQWQYDVYPLRAQWVKLLAVDQFFAAHCGCSPDMTFSAFTGQRALCRNQWAVWFRGVLDRVLGPNHVEHAISIVNEASAFRNIRP